MDFVQRELNSNLSKRGISARKRPFQIDFSRTKVMLDHYRGSNYSHLCKIRHNKSESYTGAVR